MPKGVGVRVPSSAPFSPPSRHLDAGTKRFPAGNPVSIVGQIIPGELARSQLCVLPSGDILHLILNWGKHPLRAPAGAILIVLSFRWDLPRLGYVQLFAE